MEHIKKICLFYHILRPRIVPQHISVSDSPITVTGTRTRKKNSLTERSETVFRS